MHPRVLFLQVSKLVDNALTRMGAVEKTEKNRRGTSEPRNMKTDVHLRADGARTVILRKTGVALAFVGFVFL